MLADFFDFGKRRTLKQALGLFACYAVVFFLVFIIVSILGSFFE